MTIGCSIYGVGHAVAHAQIPETVKPDNADSNQTGADQAPAEEAAAETTSPPTKRDALTQGTEDNEHSTR